METIRRVVEDWLPEHVIIRTCFYSVHFSSLKVWFRWVSKVSLPQCCPVCLWNPESRALESEIYHKESRIPKTIGVRNPSTTDKKPRNPVPGIRNPERGIQIPRLDYFVRARARKSLFQTLYFSKLTYWLSWYNQITVSHFPFSFYTYPLRLFMALIAFKPNL